MDPCGKCGATILAGSETCRVCGAPVLRQTSTERAEARRGPRIAAAISLAALGALLVVAAIAVFGADAGYAGYRRVRVPFALIALGLGCFGAAARTFLDEG
ncbi:MAG TPA: hypothetical protein VFF73_31445 [Planctomycetota bacterium]|nr:hypothetical protein [Planctomycetota bacterium]